MPKWCKYLVHKGKNIISIYDPIFTTNIYIVICKSEQRFKEIIKNEMGIDVDLMGGAGQTLYAQYKDDPECCLVWASDAETTLMHECLHASAWVAKTVGIKDAGTEFLAYHQEFLFKCATKN